MNTYLNRRLATFDRVLPVEDPDKLMNIMNEVRRRPSLAEKVDFSEEREALDRLTAMLNGKQREPQS
jgi:hypothetical protein